MHADLYASIIYSQVIVVEILCVLKSVLLTNATITRSFHDPKILNKPLIQVLEALRVVVCLCLT